LLPDQDGIKRVDLTDVKKRLSDQLLPLDFVSGVGSTGSGLTIYLTRALGPAEERKVKKIVDKEASGKSVDFVETGEFKAN
jgi:hypothetical protein